jgi:hypothetical protein
MIDRHGISKENILYLSSHGYFERVPFAKSIAEFDVGFDHGQQFQPAELFKRPFTVELMGAGFDKPANTRYFALRFQECCRSMRIARSKIRPALRSCRRWQSDAEKYQRIVIEKRHVGLGGCKEPTILLKDRGPALPAIIQILPLSRRRLRPIPIIVQRSKAPDNRKRRTQALGSRIQMEKISSIRQSGR